MKKYTMLLVAFVCLTNVLLSQEDIRIGRDPSIIRNQSGAYFDYSEAQSINIKVSVWGFVKFPGKYVIPENSDIIDLLSYAGGPNEDALLEDIRLYKKKDSGNSDNFIKVDYNELLWKENLPGDVNKLKLDVGDVLLVPGTPRLHFRDYFQMTLQIVSTLISLTILILNISRN